MFITSEDYRKKVIQALRTQVVRFTIEVAGTTSDGKAFVGELVEIMSVEPERLVIVEVEAAKSYIPTWALREISWELKSKVAQGELKSHLLQASVA